MTYQSNHEIAARRAVEIIKEEKALNIEDIKGAKQYLHNTSRNAMQDMAMLQQHGAGVTKIIAGTGITITGTSSVTGLGDVTISSSGSVGGSDTQVQFNDNGSLNGDSNFTFDKSAGGSFFLETPDASVGNNGGNAEIDGGTSGDGRAGASMVMSGATNAGAGGSAFMQGGSGGSNADGDVVLGLGNTSTTRNGNFVYIPASGGTPTGTPTSHAGLVAITYDTGANKLWIYNGSWKFVQLS